MKNKIVLAKPSSREFLTLALLAIEIAFFAIFADGFISSANLLSIVQNSAEISLISIGMTLVMVLGGIDLSVGSMMGIIAIIAANMFQNNSSFILIIGTALLSGALLGLLNGFIITFFNVPEMVATIGTNNIFRMLVFLLLGGKWITGLRTVMGQFNSARVFGIPVLFMAILIVYVVFYYITMNRPFGRKVYACGSNPKAAELTGINQKRVKLTSYVILGTLVGMAALLYIGRMGSVEMSIGVDIPLQCIAAVTIGGTSVTGRGSKGSLVGTLAGVYFIAILRNGIVIMGIPSLLENAFIGALIILSLTLDYVLNKYFSRQSKVA